MKHKRQAAGALTILWELAKLLAVASRLANKHKSSGDHLIEDFARNKINISPNVKLLL